MATPVIRPQAAMPGTHAGAWNACRRGTRMAVDGTQEEHQAGKLEALAGLQREAAQEVGGRQALAAGRCSSVMTQPALAAGDVDAVRDRSTVPGSALPPWTAAAPARPRSSPSRRRSARLRRERDRRRECAARWRRPAATSRSRFGLLDLVRVGDALGGLRRARRPPQAASSSASTIMRPPSAASLSCRCAVVSPARWRRARSSSMSPVSRPASICMMVTPVSRIARFDGAMDRRGAAPARQQGRVDVEAAQARQVQHPLRQDQAIGGHHHHVGPRGQQRFARGCRIVGVLAVQAQAARLGDRRCRAPARTA
jgi:hypothetical protein